MLHSWSHTSLTQWNWAILLGAESNIVKLTIKLGKIQNNSWLVLVLWCWVWQLDVAGFTSMSQVHVPVCIRMSLCILAGTLCMHQGSLCLLLEGPDCL